MCQSASGIPGDQWLFNVGDSTRARVEKIISELNYSPNTQARGLASSRSYLLGLIYDNPDALYLDDVQRGVLEVCSQLGYETGGASMSLSQ